MSAFASMNRVLIRTRSKSERKEQRMKKKIVVIISVLIVALLASQATVFAAVIDPVSPQYNEVTSIEDYINYTGGTLYFGVEVLVPNRDTLDYVIINAELRTMGGESIRTFNKRLAYAYGQFTYDREYVPDHNGLYYVKYTVNCYKDGKAVDVITKTTNNEWVKVN